MPSRKLKVRELASRYEVGLTSVREALAQLAASGIIDYSSQRGFWVPHLDTERCLDLMRTRQILECQTFRLAIENRNRAWEDRIVTSYSLLAREIERIYQREMPTIQPYWGRHTEFHLALLSACPLRNLRSFVEDIYQRLGMYRRLTYTDGFEKDFVAREHQALMEAALGDDVSMALATMENHILKNMTVMKNILSGYAAQGQI